MRTDEWEVHISYAAYELRDLDTLDRIGEHTHFLVLEIIKL